LVLILIVKLAACNSSFRLSEGSMKRVKTGGCGILVMRVVIRGDRYRTTIR
jgi:hypothetical protein